MSVGKFLSAKLETILAEFLAFPNVRDFEEHFERAIKKLSELGLFASFHYRPDVLIFDVWNDKGKVVFSYQSDSYELRKVFKSGLQKMIDDERKAEDFYQGQ